MRRNTPTRHGKADNGTERGGKMHKDITDEMTTEERQRLNQRLAEWFNG